MRSIDFERVLRSRSRAQTFHFAVHHVEGVASPSAQPCRRPADTELSTGGAQVVHEPVDESLGAPQVLASASACDTHWLGAVVPKRHARRAVTRTLLKRQIRAAAERHGARLPPGLWVVRLRAPFDRKIFVSASSTRLRDLARAELDSAFVAAAAPSLQALSSQAPPARRPLDEEPSRQGNAVGEDQVRRRAAP